MTEKLAKFGFFKGFGRRAAGAADQVPGYFARGVHDADKAKALAGYKAQAISEGGPDSLLAAPFLWAGEKMLGRERVHNALWRGVSRPALMADIAAGNVLSKTPLVGGAFKTTEKVPWGDGFYKDVQRNSALAPIMELRDFAMPFVAGYGLEKGLEKVRDFRHNRGQNPMDKKPATAPGLSDQDLREKVASAMLQLQSENKGHRKRAHATKVLFKQVELGLCDMPTTHREYEEKIASLINQDLVVFEKALELTGGSTKLGEVAQGTLDSTELNPSELFQAAVLGEEV